MEERSSAQEESTREAQGGIAGCVVLAQGEALKLKHNSIGAEHMLDGLLMRGEGLAVFAFASTSAKPQETRSRGAHLAVPRHAPPPALHLEQCDDRRIIEMICATAGKAPAGDEKPVGAVGVEAPLPWIRSRDRRRLVSSRAIAAEDVEEEEQSKGVLRMLGEEIAEQNQLHLFKGRPGR